jgi:hypothetical protein
MGKRKAIRLAMAMALSASVGVGAVRSEVVHATSCSAGHNSGSAWSQCVALPSGYKHRVKGHYSTGINTGGYVFGTYVPGYLTSIVYHSNMDSAIVQICTVSC